MMIPSLEFELICSGWQLD